MNKTILVTVSTTVLLLNAITANSAPLTIYQSDNSTPFVSLNSPFVDKLESYNNRVYSNNGTAGSKVKELGTTDLSTLFFISKPTQAATKLGQGMDHDLDSMAGQCIQGTEVTPASNTSAEISIDGSYSRKEFLKDFASGAHGGGIWGVFSGSASGDYARLTKDDKLSLVYLYKSRYVLATKSLIDYSVIPGLATETPEDLHKFRNQCGDQFVKDIVLGGSLFYTIRLNFQNATDRRTVKAAAKASFLGFGGGGSFSKTTQTISNRGSITISASQSGGNVALLGTALASTTGNSLYSQIVCDFSDMSKCAAFVDSLAKYASTEFPKQLNENKEANVISTRYLDYQFAGVPQLPPPRNLTNNVDTDPVWINRIDIARQLADNVRNTVAAERLKVFLDNFDDPLFLQVDELRVVEESLQILSNRREQLEAISTVCWSRPNECSKDIRLFALLTTQIPRELMLQPEHLKLLADLVQ